MGWQDAPELSTPAWASAPVVDGAADAKRQLAQDTGIGESMLIGAGRTGDKLYAGMRQGGLGIAGIFSEVLPERLRRAAQDALTEKLAALEKEQADNDKQYRSLANEHPIATGVGEAAPLAAAPLLRVVEGAGAIPAMVNMAASSALPSALEYGTAAQRGTNAALSGTAGALGAGALKLGGKILAPVPSSLSAEGQRLAGVANDIGIDLTAGQKTGNKFLQTVESVMESMPATSASQTAIRQGQREALTRAVMERLGESTGEATPATVAAAKSRVGGDFERIFSKVDVPLDSPGVQTSLGKIVQEANATLPGDTARVVRNRISELIDKVDENGVVQGKAYQAWRSQVQKQAEGTNDNWLREQLRNVYRAVDQVAYQAAEGVGEAGNLATARGRYRDIMAISPLVNRGAQQQAVIEGTLSPSGLMGAAASGGTEGLKEIARAGKAFVQEQIQNSGSPQRALVQNLMTGSVLGTGLGGATWAATGDPLQGLKAAGGGLAATVMLPKLMQAGINSGVGQRYLSGGFGRDLSPIEQALMDRAARLAASSGEHAFAEQ